MVDYVWGNVHKDSAQATSRGASVCPCMERMAKRDDTGPLRPNALASRQDNGRMQAVPAPPMPRARPVQQRQAQGADSEVMPLLLGSDGGEEYVR